VKVKLADKRLRRYKPNWLRHVTKMKIRMPKVMIKYR